MIKGILFFIIGWSNISESEMIDIADKCFNL